MNIDMRDPVDGSFFEDAIEELDYAFGEPITVRRWTGKGAGNEARGIAAGDTYTNIKAQAVITEMTARDINYPGSIFAQGDMKLDCTVEIKGAESYSGDQASAPRGADLILYRGREYRIIGTVNRHHLHGRTHFEATMRRQG